MEEITVHIGEVAFSILERIDVGETLVRDEALLGVQSPFSILERIDVGETKGESGDV